VGNLLEKIKDPMAIMIRVVRLIAEYFCLLWEFLGFFYFLEPPLRILGGFTWTLRKEPRWLHVFRILDGFTWRLQKNPPISNSKIVQSKSIITTYSYILVSLMDKDYGIYYYLRLWTNVDKRRTIVKFKLNGRSTEHRLLVWF
jgi:hypothetical protein